MTGVSNRVLLLVAVVIGLVGSLDAFISQEWDLLAVFILILTVQLMLWLRHHSHRIPVTLRPDLTRWVEHYAQETGEPFDDVLDRAVAGYQHGLFDR